MSGCFSKFYQYQTNYMEDNSEKLCLLISGLKEITKIVNGGDQELISPDHHDCHVRSVWICPEVHQLTDILQAGRANSAFTGFVMVTETSTVNSHQSL